MLSLKVEKNIKQQIWELLPVKFCSVNASKSADIPKTNHYFSAGTVAYVPPVWLVFEQDGDKVKVLYDVSTTALFYGT